jgi:flagellar protein FliO/FliZ
MKALVHSGRPHPCSRLLLAPALLLTAGLLPAAATAGGFRRDETPLPADVTGVGATAHANLQSAGSGGGTVLHMLLALGIVIALILGLYKLLRHLSGRRDGGPVRADGRMTVVASTPLAHSRSLHLVRVGQELVLVGSAEQAVTPIRVYSAEEARTLAPDGDDGGMRPLGPGGGAERPGFVGSLTDSLRKLAAR